MGVFTTTFSNIDNALDTYILDISTDIIGQASPIFTSMIIIWLAIWGYMTMFGKTQEPMTDGFMKIMRISFIIALALSVGTYNGVVVDFLKNSPKEVAAIITGSPTNNSGAIIDNLALSVLNTASQAWAEGGLGNIGMYIIAIVLLGFGGAMLIITAVMFALSTVYTTILLAVGPIFIMLLLFENTKRYFESWISSLMNYGFILILASAITQLTISMTENFMTNHPAGFANLSGCFTITIVFCFNIAVLKQIPTLASALGGGFAMATNTGIGNALNRMRPTHMRRSVRQIRQDARIAGRALTAPGRALNNALNSSSYKSYPAKGA